MRCAGAGALAAAVLAWTPARAEDKAPPAPPLLPPDPAAVEAGEANLESIASRKGIIGTLGIGPAFSVGLSMTNATGQGAATTLRLAHVANARTMVAIEIVNSTLLFLISPGEGLDKKLYQTNATNFLISGQFYLNEALWLRGGLGWGRYAGDRFVVDIPAMGESVVRERFRYAGPAASAGAGIDVVRLNHFRASLEFCSTLAFNRDGAMSSNGILLGLALD